MTWEELKEEAKKTTIYWNFYSNITGTSEWITDHCWCFDKDGTVMFNGEVVAHDRTPDQMLAIMKALQ